MINVNEVYETVLAICNKENRGYITPQEFNLFANQAQNSIFYSYFYDLDTAKKRSFSSDYVSKVNLLEDKLHPFKFDTTITDGDSISSLDAFYRLANVYYKAPNAGDQEGIIVEEISSFDRIRIQQSPLTRATIDRPMYYISGDLFFDKTHVPEMLKRSKCRLNIKVKTLMMIDSLEMTEKDIEKIIEECQKSSSSRIVITHGTDTMVNTAKKIAEKIKNKTIILTGAMIPYAFGSSSDGFFNLGSALSFAQTLQNGVYIAINGQYFDYDKVRKNNAMGYFEKI